MRARARARTQAPPLNCSRFSQQILPWPGVRSILQKIKHRIRSTLAHHPDANGHARRSQQGMLATGSLNTSASVRCFQWSKNDLMRS